MCVYVCVCVCVSASVSVSVSVGVCMVEEGDKKWTLGHTCPFHNVLPAGLFGWP